MKRHLLTLLILFGLMPASAGFAQDPAPVIASLTIEIWPDYDQASVLVLLTGMLPGDTRLPASVSLPLPKGARLNAVARIESRDGNMRDDISWSTDTPDTLTFTTPDLRFRVEYYFPYTVDKNRHSFDYTWLAAVTVNNFQLMVQRPTSAGTFTAGPGPASVVRRDDGFEYYTFPARAVPSGQPFSAHVDYETATAQMSVTSLPPSNTGVQPSALPAVPGTGFGFNWALAAIVVGGFIIIGALIWQIAARRRSPDIHKAIESRVEQRSGSRFCSNCGEPIDKGDRFCRECGSEV
jgi:zinc-ribbon domain